MMNGGWDVMKLASSARTRAYSAVGAGPRTARVASEHPVPTPAKARHPRAPLAIPGGRRLGLHMGGDARQLDDGLGGGRPPVGLEGLDRHPGPALEERDRLDHDPLLLPSGRAPLRRRGLRRVAAVALEI